jgi:cytidylate kinase
MNNFVIAITRTCGSGGTSIARMLCKDYNIRMYDKELMRLASQDSGINEELFLNADEEVKRSHLYKAYKKVYKGELIPPESGNYVSDENLFNYQAKVLKELAKHESYICIGRCADYVLKDLANVIRVFIHADYDKCVAHEMERSKILRKEAEEYIRKMDKYRSTYYRYHTGRDWYDVRNYDLSINTQAHCFEKSVRIIEDFVANIMENKN